MLRFRLEVCAGLDAPLRKGIVRACFGGIPGRDCKQAVVGGVLVVSSVWLVFVPVTVSGGAVCLRVYDAAASAVRRPPFFLV